MGRAANEILKLRDEASNWIEAYKKYFHTDHPLPEDEKR
jgi:hypothetical protein